METDGIDLTDEQRAAAEYFADSDNPFRWIAVLMCYLDDPSSVDEDVAKEAASHFTPDE
ncbi:hypothetical protein PN417_00465 [Halorubrum ezzemoulense]|jgi:hypothetical protein|uniref:hypothetical protein n=1 Tax=Halorubrum ezzemoulense TaxID=337243 RepID=UPI00232C349C|nr:hypothetical protein [Halorubrum ezzemoulense]MDB9299422.1 hypothetical protein [Halorubrum ezzemoulense]